MPSDALRIEHIVIVTPPAEMDDIHEAADVVVDALKKHPPTGVVIDLHRVKLYPSAFQAFLLRCSTVAKGVGAAMVIAEASELGLEALGVSNLDRLWTFHRTREEAVTALAKRTK